MIITTWAITGGIAMAISLVLVLAWSSQWELLPWATAWIVMALFGAMEMWQAEHRLGMARAWKSAYFRDTDLLQKRIQQLRQQLSLRASSRRDTDSVCAEFLPLSVECTYRIPQIRSHGERERRELYTDQLDTPSTSGGLVFCQRPDDLWQSGLFCGLRLASSSQDAFSDFCSNALPMGDLGKLGESAPTA